MMNATESSINRELQELLGLGLNRCDWRHATHGLAISLWRYAVEFPGAALHLDLPDGTRHLPFGDCRAAYFADGPGDVPAIALYEPDGRRTRWIPVVAAR